MDEIAATVRRKAGDCRKNHARRYGYPADELTDHYGWRLDRIVADMLAALGAPCPCCGRTCDTLGELHVDVIDATYAPWYGLNTRVICGTCNRSKGTRTLGAVCADAERRHLERQRVTYVAVQLTLWSEAI